MKLAAIQTVPHDENLELNIRDHLRLSQLAAAHQAELVLFPEMSLTGYLLAAAQQHAVTPDDLRLEPLRQQARDANMVIVAGAPVDLDGQLYIGALALLPDGTVEVYTKHHLHEGEDQYFAPGRHNPALTIGQQPIALAICADIDHPEHAAAAALAGAAVYLPGIFFSPNGIASGHQSLQQYAEQHAMPVLMSNYGGPSHYNWPAAGQSAFWNNKGQMLGNLAATGEGILLAEQLGDQWQVKVVEVSNPL
jgi:predicted amidohydrolase